MVKPKALIACLADPSGNPRPNRAIQLLDQMGYEVWALSKKPRLQVTGLSKVLPLEEIRVRSLQRLVCKSCILVQAAAEIIQIQDPLIDKLSWIKIGGLKQLATLKRESFQVILIEDLIFLPNILREKSRQSTIIFDAREYYPREFESSLLFNLLHAPRAARVLRQSLSKLNGFYTVCDSLADAYLKDFGRKPEVIRSTPFRLHISPRKCTNYPLKMVHHGGANPDRGLEVMIDVIKALDGRFVLDFYLTGNQVYIERLRRSAQDCPWIAFRPPVAFEDLCKQASQYDIGFYLLQPSGFNTKFALPNKFFEFIQAGLAVITGPSPEMAKLIMEYSVGAVSRDFSSGSMIELLSHLTIDSVNQMREASRQAAQELCWEVESLKLRRVLEGAIQGRGDIS